jgi:lipoprotein-anchoring transpeptidase ErfK/SrfK
MNDRPARRSPAAVRREVNNMRVQSNKICVALLALATITLTGQNAAAQQVGAETRQRFVRASAEADAASPARPGPGQLDRHAEYDESAWSDRYTGGRVERGELVAGDTNVEITVDVPAFRLTLWQSGREIKTYRIGVGMKDYPIIIGERDATEVIWNPAWIPPASDWVSGHKGVKPGQVIKASDPRNPLGRVKVPLGGGYLIHQAKGAGDLGSLVSHGCVRMLLADLLDLAAKLNVAYGQPVTDEQIAGALRTKRTLVATLDPTLPVDINYDTLVVEDGALHIYPDVYDRGANTPTRLRAELTANGIDAAQLDQRTLDGMLARVKPRTEYVVSLDSIAAGRALEDGQLRPVVPTPTKRPPAKRKAARRTR